MESSYEKTPEVLVEETAAELASYFEMDPAAAEFGELVVNTMADLVAFTDSVIRPEDVLSVKVVIGEGKKAKSATFRHLPTPGALWAFLNARAEAGQKVAVTVQTGRGKRTVSEDWPFALNIAEEMTRPTGEAVLLPSTDKKKFYIKRVGNYNIVAGVYTGPPTWKLPKARLYFGEGLYVFEGGWLRALAFFGFVRRNASGV